MVVYFIYSHPLSRTSKAIVAYFVYGRQLVPYQLKTSPLSGLALMYMYICMYSIECTVLSCFS